MISKTGFPCEGSAEGRRWVRCRARSDAAQLDMLLRVWTGNQGRPLPEALQGRRKTEPPSWPGAAAVPATAGE